MNRNYRLLFCGWLLGFLLLGAGFNPEGYSAVKVKKKPQKAPPPSSKAAKKSGPAVREGQVLYIKTEKANLRASPADQSDNIIETLPRETQVSLLKRQGSWYLVKLEDGRIGWMAASVLAPKKEEPEAKPTPAEKPKPSARTKEVPKLPLSSQRPPEATPTPLPQQEIKRLQEPSPTPLPMREIKPPQPEARPAEGGKAPSDMVFIPSGEAIVGSSEEEINRMAQRQGVDLAELMDEKPKRQVFVKGFFIDKYEVTQAQYKKFVDATGHKPPLNWEGNTYPAGKGEHPVVFVSWEDAKAYCEWAGKRLPTGEEWEKAARGSEGRVYPWGNEYGGEKVNLVNAGRGDTAPVGEYKGDLSPYEVHDMGGNVSEWTSSWYDSDKNSYILKGGSWYNEIYTARGAQRTAGLPEYRLNIVGFRCAKSP